MKLQAAGTDCSSTRINTIQSSNVWDTGPEKEDMKKGINKKLLNLNYLLTEF